MHVCSIVGVSDGIIISDTPTIEHTCIDPCTYGIYIKLLLFTLSVPDILKYSVYITVTKFAYGAERATGFIIQSKGPVNIYWGVGTGAF